MNIKTIMKPITKDLDAFKLVLDGFVDGIENEKVKANFKTFFKNKGKFLRPSLLFMAHGTVASKANDKLYKLALVLELLHSASLIHDDIIDGDDYRRGNKTVNSVFGNKVGVLAGDTLFSSAFVMATESFDKDYNVLITELTLAMCQAELIQANSVDSKEIYLSVIEGKTAKFMSVCCELGGMCGDASDAEIEALREFGMNLGMTYQIIDDFIDSDENALAYINRDEADAYYEKAMANLEVLSQSSYKDSLMSLLEFVMKMTS